MGTSQYTLCELIPPEPSGLTEHLISLHPAASWALEQQGRNYCILDDFLDERDLLEFSADYFKRQLRWYDQADSFLKEHISWVRAEQFDFARAYYFRLKYLADDFVLRSKFLHAWIRRVNPSDVQLIFEGNGDSQIRSIFNYNIEERRSYQPVLAAMAKVYPDLNISFKENPGTGNKAWASAERRHFPGPLRHYARQMMRFHRYQKWARFGKAPECRGGVLFLDAGTQAVDLVIRRVIRETSKPVFFESPEGDFLQIDTWEEKTIPVLSSKEEFESSEWNQLRSECVEAGKAIREAGLFDFYDRESGVETETYLLPYWQNFITEVIPQTYREINKHRRFYKRKNVGTVFQRDCTTVRAVGALLAAQKDNVKRVCLQHGFNLTCFEALYRTELDLFDYTVVQDDDTLEYFEAVSVSGVSHPCEVAQSPDYFEYLSNQAASVRKKEKNKIIYLCGKVTAGIRCLNSLIHPFAWYFEYLKKICTLFSNHPECEFILKLGGNQRWDQNSIVGFLAKNAWSNIKIETQPFTNYLDQADRIITDSPSTGFYEAVASKKSVLALCRTAYKLRPSVKRLFGGCVRDFTTAEDAVRHIEDFLSGNPDDYRAFFLNQRMTPNFFKNLIETT